MTLNAELWTFRLAEAPAGRQERAFGLVVTADVGNASSGALDSGASLFEKQLALHRGTVWGLMEVVQTSQGG